MKKRSLVAAIAMLVVSAIVLTSSTYAWFASSANASVSGISANVANNNGALQVTATTNASAASPQPKTTLTDADFNLITDLNPVSMSIADGAQPAFYKANYDGTTFTPGAAGAASTITSGVASGDYVKYGFDVTYTNGDTSAQVVEIAPTWSQTSNFTYALIEFTRDVSGTSTTTYYLCGTGYAGTYEPLVGITANTTVTDSNKAANKVDIIDDQDDNHTNATIGNVVGATAFTAGDKLTFAAAAADTNNPTVVTTASVNVYIWAEGQDPQCYGTAASGSGTMTFAIGLQ